MTPLPPCRWRGEPDADRYACHSARFLGAPNRVGAEFCRQCAYVDHDPVPPRPALPCVHLGGAKALAATFPAGLKVFPCVLHGSCTPARSEAEPPDGVRVCARCPDYLPRDPFGPNSAEMRRRADAFLAAVPDYPAGRYSGRGVVLAGGGDRYFASVYVTVRALRHVGCRLPVQLWYLGRNDEMPARLQALLAPYGVECVDADAVRRERPARRLNGWELKVFATLHSPFEEVLFLDADCYPCRDPAFLFGLEDYRACGAVFWPDLVVTDHRLKWAAFGVPDPGRLGTVESGQYVIHKRLGWLPLNLAWFYNDYSDYYYRYGYGDKHTFEVAWARCGQPYVMWRPVAQWVDVAFLHTGPDGAPLFVHRCADKFRLRPEPFLTPQCSPRPTYHARLPLEAECWQWLGELTRSLAPAPVRVARIDLPEHFNCSLLEYEGRLLLASRRGWYGSRLYLSELDPDYQPRWTRPLDLAHPRAAAGLEDPRLFVFRGRLHCAFTGVEERGGVRYAHQLLCRLDEAYRVEEVWLPEYEGRTPWEKNWQFFEQDGELYSVYSVSPHVVLRHDGRRAEKVAETAGPPLWPDCRLRGGAPPVRVGDEYYHFFHGALHRGGRGDYAAGVYTFAAGPPFAVRRAAPAPVLLPDEHDRRDDLNLSVVFPCGALRRDGHWVISYGYHDRECRIAVVEAAEVERALRPG